MYTNTKLYFKKPTKPKKYENKQINCSTLEQKNLRDHICPTKLKEYNNNTVLNISTDHCRSP